MMLTVYFYTAKRGITLEKFFAEAHLWTRTSGTSNFVEDVKSFNRTGVLPDYVEEYVEMLQNGDIV